MPANNTVLISKQTRAIQGPEPRLISFMTLKKAWFTVVS